MIKFEYRLDQDFRRPLPPDALLPLLHITAFSGTQTVVAEGKVVLGHFPILHFAKELRCLVRWLDTNQVCFDIEAPGIRFKFRRIHDQIEISREHPGLEYQMLSVPVSEFVDAVKEYTPGVLKHCLGLCPGLEDQPEFWDWMSCGSSQTMSGFSTARHEQPPPKFSYPVNQSTLQRTLWDVPQRDAVHVYYRGSIDTRGAIRLRRAKSSDEWELEIFPIEKKSLAQARLSFIDQGADYIRKWFLLKSDANELSSERRLLFVNDRWLVDRSSAP